MTFFHRNNAFGCSSIDVFICSYMWAICVFARDRQPSKGLLFSMCHSFTKVHCSGGGLFTWINVLTLMLAWEGELFVDDISLTRSKWSVFPFPAFTQASLLWHHYVNFDTFRLSRQRAARGLERGFILEDDAFVLRALLIGQQFVRLETANNAWLTFHCGDEITFALLLWSLADHTVGDLSKSAYSWPEMMSTWGRSFKSSTRRYIPLLRSERRTGL